MRPRTVGGNTPYTTEIFTDQFKTVLGKFSTLRTMDFSATNANLATNWSDRTVPADASQSVGNPNGQPPPWEGRGAAWEYMVELANETGKDLWINVPERATDDYVNKLALLCKYGSDGINPYTGPQANPAWPPLNSNLKLYVEFSNEVWNTAGSFEQSQDNHNSAIAEVHAGGSPLNFDTDTNDWNWAWRRVAKRIVEISNAFRSVFGDADMMTRVRPVLMSQLGYADGPLLQEMHLMQDYYNNPANVGTPRPPSYYVYGIGGSAYYNPSDKSSVNQIFATMASGFASDLQADANWALAFGVKRIAYEGGPSLDSTGNSTQDANQAAAWIDPRMKQVVIDEQNLWSQNAGDLLVYFQIAGDYQWGFTDDVLNLSHPKMQAIDALNSVAAAPSTYGTPIPATIAASTYAIPPTWFDGAGATLASRRWRGYPVSVSAANAFSVVLNVAANASGAQAEVFMDGQSLGVLAIPNTGSTSNFTDTAALVTANLAPGSHGIMVRNVTGSFVLNQIKVQAVTLTGSTTTISSNNNPSTAGQAVTFTASVTPANVTGTVQFKDGNTNLGAPIASSNGTATLTTSALSVATHAITASYSGDGGFLPSSSAALSQVVTAAGPISTSTALTLNPSKVIFFHQRAPWSLTVAVSATSTPDGSVVFMDGTRQLATKTLDGSGTASYSAPLRPGMHSIHAVYMGNSNFSGSSSSTQVVNVSPRPKPR